MNTFTLRFCLLDRCGIELGDADFNYGVQVYYIVLGVFSLMSFYMRGSILLTDALWKLVW